MSSADQARRPPGKAPGSEAGSKGRSRARTMAEWFSLAISTLLILGVAGFLLFEATRPSSPHVFPVVRALPETSRSSSGLHTLPVEVRNTGSKTLRSLRIGLTYTGADGKPRESDLDIDYLGERSTETVYFYLEEDPRTVKDLDVRPITYQVE